VDGIVRRRESLGKMATATSDVRALIYSRDIRSLNDSISRYLGASRKDVIWLLFDNLDKGWPVLDVRPEDVAIIRSLLEATRKLQRQFANRAVELHSIVFLRNDIYDHLILDPADRGKENPVILDWNDAEALKEMLRRRIALSTELEESFEELWGLFFASHVLGEESFSYILSRTLMRPRELLHFVRECITVAINRGHDQVAEQDISYAEQSYSDDALVDLSMELKDINPKYGDVPYAFIGAHAVLVPSDVGASVISAGIPADEIERIKDVLLWFGFLGIFIYPEEERYSYQFEHNLQKMRSGISEYAYCIHPAFRKSLGCILS
jgi:hypothetical protein